MFGGDGVRWRIASLQVGFSRECRPFADRGLALPAPVVAGDSVPSGMDFSTGPMADSVRHAAVSG